MSGKHCCRVGCAHRQFPEFLRNPSSLLRTGWQHSDWDDNVGEEQKSVGEVEAEYKAEDSLKKEPSC